MLFASAFAIELTAVQESVGLEQKGLNVKRNGFTPRVNNTVLIIDKRRSKVVDEAIVTKCIPKAGNGRNCKREIWVKSLLQRPGQIVQYGFVRTEMVWRRLFVSPLSGGRCYILHDPKFLIADGR